MSVSFSFGYEQAQKLKQTFPKKLLNNDGNNIAILQ